MNSSRPAAVALIAANLFLAAIPLVLGWNLASLLLVYWIELWIIGFFTILKMVFAGEKGELGKSRSYQVIFFIAHYATFVVLYGTLLRVGVVGGDARVAGIAGVLLSLPLFFGSHAISFKQNYLDRKESARTSSLLQMVEPYKRILPIQVVLLIGALAIRQVGESPMPLILVILAKLAVDLAVHTYLHRPPR